MLRRSKDRFSILKRQMPVSEVIGSAIPLKKIFKIHKTVPAVMIKGQSEAARGLIRKDIMDVMQTLKAFEKHEKVSPV